jgi:arylformamidase
VQGVLSISGLHDLRPLLQTKMSRALRLSQAEAASESAALCTLAYTHAEIIAWVGGGAQDRASPKVMGLTSLGREIGIF